MTGWASSWRGLPLTQRRMVLTLAAIVAVANIAQPYPETAWLQHLPTVVLLLGAPAVLTRWPLSDGAVRGIALFFAIHTLAGRYGYSNLPYDDWARWLSGRDISGAFGLQRNGADRVIHFLFGLLMVTPVAEIAQRYGGMTRTSGSITAILFVGAASAGYEIVEWWLTLLAPPDLAADYNGQQGDGWDAQKDMALALLGSVMAAAYAGRKRGGGG